MPDVGRAVAAANDQHLRRRGERRGDERRGASAVPVAVRAAMAVAVVKLSASFAILVTINLLLLPTP